MYKGGIVFTLINVKVMAIVLLSLIVIIKILPWLVLKKKKKVESFSFEDRIVPVRHMTCVSLSEFTVIWIDHIHKRNTDSLGARWNFRYLLLHPVAAVSSAWSAGAVMMKCVLFIVMQQTTPNAYYLLVCVSQDSGAAVGPGLVWGSLTGCWLTVTWRCDWGSRVSFHGGSVMPAEAVLVAGKRPHFSTRGCLHSFRSCPQDTVLEFPRTSFQEGGAGRERGGWGEGRGRLSRLPPPSRPFPWSQALSLVRLQQEGCR